MNKIICDVCGTAYQETATQCPICGCVRTPDVDDILNENAYGDAARTYTYVKGGRFSKANVKKRNKNNVPTENTPATVAARRTPPKKKKSNTGLVIAIIILLLAIVAVVIYMAVNVFWRNSDGNDKPSVSEQTVSPSVDQNEPDSVSIPCEKLTLEADEVTLTQVGEIRKIHAEPKPRNTTDIVRYDSSDPSVVTVSQDGVITAVGYGTADIIVTCGNQNAICTVICNVEEPTEETTVDTLEPFIVSAEDVWLNRREFELTFEGQTHDVYSGTLNRADLQWISNNDANVKFENGIATAVRHVAYDYTTVHVVYTENDITNSSSIVVNLHDSISDETCEVTCIDTDGNVITGIVENSNVVFDNLDPNMTYDVRVKVSCKVYCTFTASGVPGSENVSEG